MLSCIGKLMERMVNNRLDWILETYNLLNTNQSGFRKNHSAYDQLTLLENEIRNSLNINRTTIVVFLDLTEAFDAVDHASVLYKLSKLGIKGNMLGWLHSYLNDRIFNATFEGTLSNPCRIHSGVPQGGILSPLLFNVLLHDIPINNKIHISIFADDIAVYSSDSDPAKLANTMQKYIDELSDWFGKWHQVLDPQ